MSFSKKSTGRRAADLSTRTHIFDGVTVTTETAAFQLCDIEDALLKDMIEDEEAVRDTCNVHIPSIVGIAQLTLHTSRSETGGIRRTNSSASKLFCASNFSRCWKAMLSLTKNAKRYSLRQRDCTR